MNKKPLSEFYVCEQCGIRQNCQGNDTKFDDTIIIRRLRLFPWRTLVKNKIFLPKVSLKKENLEGNLKGLLPGYYQEAWGLRPTWLSIWFFLSQTVGSSFSPLEYFVVS